MQQIVFDQLGRLPPQFFHVIYSAPLESLAELMKLSMHWGYALRNAHGAVEDLDRMLQAGKAAAACNMLYLIRCLHACKHATRRLHYMTQCACVQTALLKDSCVVSLRTHKAFEANQHAF